MRLAQIHRLLFLPPSVSSPCYGVSMIACHSALSTLRFHSEFMIASSPVPTQQMQRSKVCEQDWEGDKNAKSRPQQGYYDNCSGNCNNNDNSSSNNCNHRNNYFVAMIVITLINVLPRKIAEDCCIPYRGCSISTLAASSEVPQNGKCFTGNSRLLVEL